MRFPYRGAAAAAVLAVAGCQAGSSGTGSNASLDSDDQKASYAIGVQVGNNLKPASGRLDVAAFTRGLSDAMEDREFALPEDTMAAVAQRFSAAINEEENARRAVEAEENMAEGEAYLTENAAREGVTETESGLQYEVLRAAEGETPEATDQVTIHYRGTLIDGTEFDSSYERGEPATFPVSGVIPGFSEGLQLMEVGSQYRFVIPGDIAYGSQGTQGDIGPNETLIFEVELLEIAP